MKFSSFEYIALLGITVILYYNIPRNFRWLMLLISSIAFLAYISVSFVGFTFLFIILNYFIARGIEKVQGAKIQKDCCILLVFCQISESWPFLSILIF